MAMSSEASSSIHAALSLTLTVDPVPRASSSRKHHIPLTELHDKRLIPVSGVAPEFKGVWTAMITERLASGWLWDAYFGLLSSPSSSGSYCIPVAIKLFSILGYEDDDELFSAVEGMERDVEALAGPLAHLQGTAVPRLFGAFGLPGFEWRRVVIHEFCGDPVSTIDSEFALNTLQPDTKTQLFKLLERVHAAGVLHNDIMPRHILRRQAPEDIIDLPLSAPPGLRWGEPGTLCLIDFDRARLHASHAERAVEASHFERWVHRITRLEAHPYPVPPLDKLRPAAS